MFVFHIPHYAWVIYEKKSGKFQIYFTTPKPDPFSVLFPNCSVVSILPVLGGYIIDHPNQNTMKVKEGDSNTILGLSLGKHEAWPCLPVACLPFDCQVCSFCFSWTTLFPLCAAVLQFPALALQDHTHAPNPDGY